VDEGYDPFDMPNLRFTDTTAKSIVINERPGSAIVIAGSGMCTAGRIKHHLKHNLWREGASLVIVGFQAKGTTGRKIVEGAKHVKIFRENVAVRAKVFTIGGFSSHADQKDILEWIGHFESRPRVFVVHGEPEASRALAGKIEETYQLAVHVPAWRERLILKPKEIAVEPAEIPREPDVKNMLLNAILDLEKELKDLRKTVKSGVEAETLSEAAVDHLRYMQEELRGILS